MTYNHATSTDTARDVRPAPPAGRPWTGADDDETTAEILNWPPVIDVRETAAPIRRVGLSPAGARYSATTKQAMDRLAGLVATIVLAPLLASIALAVLVTLGRPIIFRQQRIGLHGRVFFMYKFRTMHPDRRAPWGDVHPERDRRRRHKSAADPRHTPLGRFLRRFSLDELPQLINVLNGDMSLVGPRPELAQVAAGYAAWQHQRHLVKPGITGLWQVSARGDGGGDMHLHTDIDLDYIERLSLRTDVGILLRTLPAALGDGRGE